MEHLEDKLQQSKIKLHDSLKKSIFDWVAAIIIVALIAASLDVFGLIDLNKTTLAQFLISWFPYFAAAILLNTDLYKKGLFVGKNTEKFQNVIANYSSIANSLSGEQIKNLHPFCDTYNENALQSIQTQILRKEGICFTDFDVGFLENAAIKVQPLKTLSKEKLTTLGYTKRQISAIFKARRVKVRGLNVNILLSTINVGDITNIGQTEHSLESKQIVISSLRYMFATFLLSILAIKNIAEWGWAGLILTLFKVSYLFAGCCMSYFKGYDDATIHLANHFTRKTDVLKMYLNYIPEEVEDEDEDFVENDSETQAEVQ